MGLQVLPSRYGPTELLLRKFSRQTSAPLSHKAPFGDAIRLPLRRIHHSRSRPPGTSMLARLGSSSSGSTEADCGTSRGTDFLRRDASHFSSKPSYCNRL